MCHRSPVPVQWKHLALPLKLAYQGGAGYTLKCTWGEIVGAFSPWKSNVQNDCRVKWLKAESILVTYYIIPFCSVVELFCVHKKESWWDFIEINKFFFKSCRFHYQPAPSLNFNSKFTCSLQQSARNNSGLCHSEVAVNCHGCLALMGFFVGNRSNPIMFLKYNWKAL